MCSFERRYFILIYILFSYIYYSHKIYFILSWYYEQDFPWFSIYFYKHIMLLFPSSNFITCCRGRSTHFRLWVTLLFTREYRKVGCSALGKGRRQLNPLMSQVCLVPWSSVRLLYCNSWTLGISVHRCTSVESSQSSGCYTTTHTSKNILQCFEYEAIKPSF